MSCRLSPQNVPETNWNPPSEHLKTAPEYLFEHSRRTKSGCHSVHFHPPYAYSVPKAMRRKYRLTDKKKARKLLHITFCPTWTSRESRISHLPPRHGQKTQPCTSRIVKLTKWNIPLHAFTKRPTSPWFSILFCNFALITVKSEKYGKIHQSLYRCRF